MAHCAGEGSKATTGRFKIMYKVTDKDVHHATGLAELGSITGLSFHIHFKKLFFNDLTSRLYWLDTHPPSFWCSKGAPLGRVSGLREQTASFSPGDAPLPAPSTVFCLKGNPFLPPKYAFNYNWEGHRLEIKFTGRFGLLFSPSADQERGTSQSLFMQGDPGQHLSWSVEFLYRECGFHLLDCPWSPLEISWGYLAGKMHWKEKQSSYKEWRQGITGNTNSACKRNKS